MAKLTKKKTEKYPPTILSSGGSGATVKRNTKGDLQSTKPKDFYHTPEMQAEAKRNKLKKADSAYTGAPAPRGGKQAVIAKSGNVVGGTKKQVKASKRRVNKSAASPAAKRSAKRLY